MTSHDLTDKLEEMAEEHGVRTIVLGLAIIVAEKAALSTLGRDQLVARHLLADAAALADLARRLSS